MIAFSIRTDSRYDALDLMTRLESYSPWLLELRSDEWYVRGSLPDGAGDDVRAIVASWADERLLDDVGVSLNAGSAESWQLQ